MDGERIAQRADRELAAGRDGIAPGRRAYRRLGDAHKLPLHGAPWTDGGARREGPYAGCPSVTAWLDWQQESQNNTELTEKDKVTECTEKQGFWRFAQATDQR